MCHQRHAERPGRTSALQDHPQEVYTWRIRRIYGARMPIAVIPPAHAHVYAPVHVVICQTAKIQEHRAFARVHARNRARAPAPLRLSAP